MPLVPANQPQLIRSSQKDEYYQNNLTNNANELFHTFAGKYLTNTLECRSLSYLKHILHIYILLIFSNLVSPKTTNTNQHVLYQNSHNLVFSTFKM